MAQAKRLEVVGYFDCPGGGQVVVRNNVAYVGHVIPPDGTTIIDVADPARPRELARIAVPAGTLSHKVRVENGVMLVNREVFTDALVPQPGRRPLSAYLTMYVFGDGASAVVLQGGEPGPAEEGIVSSISGNGYGELVLRRAGGMLNLPFQGRARPAEHAFVIDGLKVAQSYPEYMNRCLEEVTGGELGLLAQVKRFYFHQPNRRVLDRFIEAMHHARVTVLLCGVRPDLMKVIDSSGLSRRLGAERVFVFQETGMFWTSTLEAVRFAYEVIGSDVCDSCPRRGEGVNETEGWYYLI